MFIQRILLLLLHFFQTARTFKWSDYLYYTVDEPRFLTTEKRHPLYANRTMDFSFSLEFAVPGDGTPHFICDLIKPKNYSIHRASQLGGASELIARKSRFTIHSSGSSGTVTFKLTQVTYFDAGNYSCSVGVGAKYKRDQDTTEFTIVVVPYEARITKLGISPHNRVKMNEVVALWGEYVPNITESGERVTFDCETNFDRLRFTGVAEHGYFSFKFTAVNESFFDTYACFVRNFDYEHTPFRDHKTVAILEKLHDPPVWTKPPEQEYYVRLGQMYLIIEMTLATNNDRSINVTCYKTKKWDDTVILRYKQDWASCVDRKTQLKKCVNVTDPPLPAEKNLTMIMGYINQDHIGEYTCDAKSQDGQDTIEFEVKLKMEPPPLVKEGRIRRGSSLYLFGFLLIYLFPDVLFPNSVIHR